MFKLSLQVVHILPRLAYWPMAQHMQCRLANYINILQGSAVTCFKCGENLNNYFVANFLLSLSVKEF